MAWWKFQFYLEFLSTIIGWCTFKFAMTFCNFTGLCQDDNLVSAELFALNLSRVYVYGCVFLIIPICFIYF